MLHDEQSVAIWLAQAGRMSPTECVAAVVPEQRAVSAVETSWPKPLEEPKKKRRTQKEKRERARKRRETPMEVLEETGIWQGEGTELHHVHDPKLAHALSYFFKNDKAGTPVSVIDLGCGMGDYVKDLREAGTQIYLCFESIKYRRFQVCWLVE